MKTSGKSQSVKRSRLFLNTVFNKNFIVTMFTCNAEYPSVESYAGFDHVQDQNFNPDSSLPCIS